MQSLLRPSSPSLHQLPTVPSLRLRKSRPTFRISSSSSSHPMKPDVAVDTSAPPEQKESKLWGGRFEESVTDAVEKFSESVSFDKALYKQDIRGSRAHATMLAHQVLPNPVF